MIISNYLALALLEFTFGKAAAPTISNVYLALCTAVPTPASTGSTISEPVGNGYARAHILSASMGSAVVISNIPTISNIADITLAAASGPYGPILAIAVCDASSGGHMLYFSPLTQGVTEGTGATPTVVAGTLVATIS